VTRLTVAQALVKFLANQYSERDGVEQRLIPGTFGIFGHGNVAGVGQALLEVADSGEMPYHLARNEQGMVHAAVGFSRMRNRLQALACTASIGPGSTNMLTARRWPPPTASRCCSCLPTSSPPASPAPCCRSWSSPTATT